MKIFFTNFLLPDDLDFHAIFHFHFLNQLKIKSRSFFAVKNAVSKSQFVKFMSLIGPNTKSLRFYHVIFKCKSRCRCTHMRLFVYWICFYDPLWYCQIPSWTCEVLFGKDVKGKISSWKFWPIRTKGGRGFGVYWPNADKKFESFLSTAPNT